MKLKLLCIILLAVTGLSLKSQTQLWGTSYSGGTNGQGTIFTSDGSGNNIHTVYNFVNATGAMPVGGMCRANNGSFYGCTELGGYGDSCVIYRYDPMSGIYTNIHDLFQNTLLGWHAFSKMLKSNSGLLYGLCGLGGTAGSGVIYQIDPSNDAYTKVYDFDGTNGGSPEGDLIQATDGKLYGMTTGGGANAAGVIFSFEPATATYTKLYVFNTATGATPNYGGLLQAADGNLYGMTYMGGATANGVIFRFNLSTGDYTDLYDFDGTNGSHPQGSLIQGTDGKLYGMTSQGGNSSAGVLFSFDLTTNSYTNMLNFNGTNGSSPRRTLTQGATGLLFGTTNGGGATGEGVAFSYDITNSEYTKLMDFTSLTTGSNPDCEFVETPELTTGIASKASAAEINIYPNPATNYINITNSGKEEMIEFTDVLGREIASVKTSALGKTTVDISGYPDVFFARMQSGAMNKIVKK